MDFSQKLFCTILGAGLKSGWERQHRILVDAGENCREKSITAQASMIVGEDGVGRFSATGRILILYVILLRIRYF